MIRTLVYIWIGFVAVSIVLMSRKPKETLEDIEERQRMLETKVNNTEIDS